MGKSRLIAEFVRIARRRGPLRRVRRECQSFGTNDEPTSSGARSGGACSKLDDDDSEARPGGPDPTSLAAIDPGLVERARRSLGDLLGVEIADPPLTRGDGRGSSGRPRSRTCSAIVLRAPVASRPVVLVLEDCHWIDRCRATSSRSSAGRRADLPGPDRPRLPAGHGAGRRDRGRDDPRLRRDRPRRAPRRGRRRADPAEARAGRDRTPTRSEIPICSSTCCWSARAGNPFSHRGADQLHRSPGRRSGRLARRSAASSCRTASTASCCRGSTRWRTGRAGR